VKRFFSNARINAAKVTSFEFAYQFQQGTEWKTNRFCVLNFLYTQKIKYNVFQKFREPEIKWSLYK